MPEESAIPEIVSLSRFLALAGIASRRRCAELARTGDVCINGEVITEPGTKVNVSQDQVTYQGTLVELGKRYYVMLNKPRGYICTAEDTHAKKKAIDLIDLHGVRLFSIGRLDKESEGLLLFTNDGDYAERLTHPRHNVHKRYHVTTDRALSRKMRQRICDGIIDNDESLSAVSVEEIGDCVYEFILNEGKKREIRRLIAAMGRKTLRLQRVAVGTLELGDLPQEKWRFLSEKEIAMSLQS